MVDRFGTDLEMNNVATRHTGNIVSFMLFSDIRNATTGCISGCARWTAEKLLVAIGGTVIRIGAGYETLLQGTVTGLKHRQPDS